MDTNLKKNEDNEPIKVENVKNPIKSTLISIGLVIIIAVTTVLGYVPVRDKVLTDRKLEKILDGNNAIYGVHNYLNNVDRSIRTDGSYFNDYYNYSKINSIKCKYLSSKGLFISNAEGQVFYERKIGEDDKSEEILQKSEETNLKNEYIDDAIFYLKFNVNASGKKTLEDVVYKDYSKKPIDDFFNEGWNMYQKQTDRSFSAEVVIPKNFYTYDDVIADRYREVLIEPDLLVLAGVLCAGAIILLLIALMMKYSSQELNPLVKLYNIVPVEFKIGLGVLIFYGLCYIAPIYNDAITFEILYFTNEYFYIIGITLTIFAYLYVYVNTVYLKSIFKKGLVEGLFKNSLIIRVGIVFAKYLKKYFLICFKIIRDIVRKLIKSLRYIDVSAKSIAILAIIVVLDIFVLVLSVQYRYYGLIAVMIYQALVLVLLSLYFYNVKRLDKETSHIASGKFEVDAESSIGLFNNIYRNLNSINNGFKVAVDKAIKSQNMKSELISNVSHDLKTPLTSIINYVDLLKQDDVDEKTREEYIKILDVKSKRLKVLIEDLFEASKASSGNIELNMEDVDVVALLRQTLGEMQEKIDQSQLMFKTKLPGAKVICRLDGRRTYRVFENILSNILKYSMKNTRVYIDGEVKDDKIIFSFKNISSYEMNFDNETITDRFTRGDKSRSTEGSGLGLAIAKSLVDLQDGRLEISTDGDLFKVKITFKQIDTNPIEKELP